LTGAAADRPQILNMKQPASRWRRHAPCRRPANRKNPEPNIAKTMKTSNRTLPGAALAIFIALLTAFPAQAQRMPQDSWYLAKEMKRFVEPGKFHNPHDAALGPDGNLYVADRYNHRVQVFTQDGAFVRQFGNYGSGNGEFNEPTGIHVAPDGKVYVCESGNHRVQVFDSQGKFIRAMGQYGSGEGQLNYPHGVTVDNDGNVYIVEHVNVRVSVFRPDGTYMRQWGGYGTANGQFIGAIAICRTPDNNIAVLERDGSEGRVQIFKPDGSFVRKFSASPQYAPHGIETDAQGNFYVTLRDWGGVAVFDSTGATPWPMRPFGRPGSAFGDELFNPMGLAVGNGKVFICDWDNHRMSVYSTGGSWAKNFGAHQKGDVDTHGVAVDSSGNIFISYYQANVIYKFSPDLAFIKSFGSPGSGDGQFNGVLEMAIGPNNRLYVVDHSGHRVQYFDLDGKFLGKFGGEGTTNGKFKFPWGIAVGKDNKVYVADRDNHRIQVFDASGNYLSKFGTQGSFDGQFQSPYGLAILPSGQVAVADNGNGRIQIFGGAGNYLGKFNFMDGVVSRYSANPARLTSSSDGLLYVSGSFRGYIENWNNYTSGDVMCVHDLLGGRLKSWAAAWCPMAETKSGDLIAAHGDRVVRVWKRTFRTVHPEPANALPLPTIVSQKRRPGTSLVDVEYTVKDADNATVQTAALAFKNGGNSLSDVIPITSFAEGTANKLGANIATGQTHRFTWDVARDWSTDFGEVQLEILAKDGRGLLNLDFIQIPAGGDQPALKISRSPLNDNDFLSVWYWLIATGDSGIDLKNGEVVVRNAPLITVNGLTANYYSNRDFTGSSAQMVQNVPAAWGYAWESQWRFGVSFQVASIKWSGSFVPQKTGQYTFRIQAQDYNSPYSLNEFDVWIRNEKVSIQRTTPNWDYPVDTFTVSCQQGQPVPIRIEYRLRDGGYYHRFQLDVTAPGENERSVANSDFQTQTPPPYLASGASTSPTGREYLFQKMGLREAFAAEVTRAKEAGTPGVINQWDPKLRVGPDERPAKINAYGFDTGADGYWVVPVSGN